LAVRLWKRAAAGTIGLVSESVDERRERLTGQVPEWYRSVMEPHDVETAFILGSYHMLQRGWVHASFARAWFAVAAENAPVDMAWRIAEEYCRWGDPRQANKWMRYAVATEYRVRPNGIAVDPGTFALVIDHRGTAVGQDFGVQVVSADDDRAGAALTAAARRIATVTADGRELSVEGPGHPDVVPAAVFGPEPAPGGPTLWCDCGDALVPLMARTMIHILAEEIRAAGLDSADIRPRPGVRVGDGATPTLAHVGR
jgi:hypothetical protein